MLNEYLAEKPTQQIRCVSFLDTRTNVSADCQITKRDRVGKFPYFTRSANTAIATWYLLDLFHSLSAACLKPPPRRQPLRLR